MGCVLDLEKLAAVGQPEYAPAACAPHTRSGAGAFSIVKAGAAAVRTMGGIPAQETHGMLIDDFAAYVGTRPARRWRTTSCTTRGAW
jgi:uncharacterized protein (UPF0303 family)